MINVWGDSIGAGIVAHLSKKEIDDYNNNQHPYVETNGTKENPAENQHKFPVVHNKGEEEVFETAF